MKKIVLTLSVLLMSINTFCKVHPSGLPSVTEETLAMKIKPETLAVIAEIPKTIYTKSYKALTENLVDVKVGHRIKPVPLSVLLNRTYKERYPKTWEQTKVRIEPIVKPHITFALIGTMEGDFVQSDYYSKAKNVPASAKIIDDGKKIRLHISDVQKAVQKAIHNYRKYQRKIKSSGSAPIFLSEEAKFLHPNKIKATLNKEGADNVFVVQKVSTGHPKIKILSRQLRNELGKIGIVSKTIELQEAIVAPIARISAKGNPRIIELLDKLYPLLIGGGKRGVRKIFDSIPQSKKFTINKIILKHKTDVGQYDLN